MVSNVEELIRKINKSTSSKKVHSSCQWHLYKIESDPTLWLWLDYVDTRTRHKY